MQGLIREGPKLTLPSDECTRKQTVTDYFQPKLNIVTCNSILFC